MQNHTQSPIRWIGSSATRSPSIISCGWKISPYQVPRIVLPDELFVNIVITIGAKVNRFLAFLQNVALSHLEGI
ncbi:hypothetical protein GIB67_025770 [Kingdonia uniflora]|uniref:Uncharacterized protein n=1 Tax=Kingdonia uniflora TaxID=39325 RepID=A0A7J7L2R6_9MAGN|nr:hypothetical protein GIB67_025770 [Kingdonia uniflora]